MNMAKTRVFIATTHAECTDMFRNPNNIIHKTVVLASKKVIFLYSLKAEVSNANMKGSEVIASFTTCHARLHLLPILILLGANVCYYGKSVKFKF